MKKKILILMLGLLLIGANVYAVGDLIVYGKLGIGASTPSAQLEVTNPYSTVKVQDSRFVGVSVSGTNVRRGSQFGNTMTSDGEDFGMTFDVNGTRSAGVNEIKGMNATIALTHNSTQSGVSGGSAANFTFQIGAPTGSGTVDINDVAGFQYTLNRRYDIPSDLTYNVNNTYGAKFKIQDGGTQTGGVVNVTNHYGSYIADYANSGTRRVNIANLTGLYIEKLIGGGVTNRGIVLVGDGAGADIVFGPQKNVSIYSDTGELFAKDGAGNVTQISPHDPGTGEWIFYSKNVNTGKVVKINMEKLVKAVEKLTGEKFMVETLGESE